MPLLGMKARLRASVAIATGVLAIFGLASYGVVAGADPQPSVTQVQTKVNQLTSQFDQDNQQYDQIAQQVSQARVKLAVVDKQVAANEAQFTKLRGAVAQIAAASYESGDTSSIAGLLTSSDPNTVLNGASLLLQISGSRNQQMQQFLTAVQRLKNSQQQAQRIKNALAAIEMTAQQKQQHASHLLASEKTVLANLTAQEQSQVQASSIGAGAVAAPAYSGSTSTNGGKAAAFAVEIAREACPYSWGGNGPCSQGWDCSGLAVAAWASAGVPIARTTEEEANSLPAISMSSLRPGDLIFYSGYSHVAIYVGGGMIVDEPNSSSHAEEIPESTDWYAQNVDSAARP